MNRYKVDIQGFFDYDMMPRVYKVVLIGKGFIEDYEVELDVFDISTMKIQSSEGEPSSSLKETK